MHSCCQPEVIMDTPVITHESSPRSEFQPLLRLALPILITQLAQMGTILVDTLMAGRVSAVELAGVALGSAFMFPVAMTMMGLIQAVTPTVSQLRGAGRPHEVGEVVRQAFWIALLGACVTIALMLRAGSFLEFMVVDPRVIPIAVDYLGAVAWGIPGLLGYFVLRAMCDGLGFTRPAMFIAVSALMLKIPLNLIFIHGYFGIPAMGGMGCGVATAIVMWLELSLILLVALRPRFRHTGWLEKFSWPDPPHILRLSKIGVPIGATLFCEMGLFSLVAVLLGRFGADVVAAHTIAINLGGIIFMFPLSLGMAATIRVGFNIGAEQFEQASRTAWIAVRVTVCVAVCSGTFVVVAREFIAGLYSKDLAVVTLASSLMLFVALFQLFDNVQATTMGALRGYKDTRLPLIFTLVGYWLVGLPVAVVLGFGWLGEPLGAYGFWTGLTVALMFVAACSLSRLWWLGRNPALILQLAAR
ncbi:MAG: MATE family multidrug resistance protein [Candidatus Pseudothioglobus sp.]|jgi:MATE family multidrug resistance protein